MKSVDIKNLAQALFDTTDGKTPEESKKALSDFAAYLVKKNLLSQFDDIITRYQILYNAKHDIVEATVTVTHALPEKIKQELSHILKQKYKAKEVHIIETIDTKILGGMKIKIGDTVLDSSLANSLYQLETQLLK